MRAGSFSLFRPRPEGSVQLSSGRDVYVAMKTLSRTRVGRARARAMACVPPATEAATRFPFRGQ